MEQGGEPVAQPVAPAPAQPAPPPPPSVEDLLTNLGDVEYTLHLDQREQWRLQRRKEKINSLCTGLTPCDGEVSSQLRNYLYDVDLLGPVVDNENAAILDVVARTTSGPLRREVQRFLAAQVEPRPQVPWNRLKAHLQRTFLSADEDEKLRSVVEQMKQSEGETLASYNRRFREAAQRAYPEPRSADAERAVLRQYLKGLRSAELSKKVSLELQTQTLEGALSFVENVEAGLERYMGLHREDIPEPMDTSSVQPVQPAGTQGDLMTLLQKMQRGQDKIMTRLTKLETGQGSMGPPADTTPRWANRGARTGNGGNFAPRQQGAAVSCFHCQGNHYKSGCPLLPRQPRTLARRPNGGQPAPGSSNQGN